MNDIRNYSNFFIKNEYLSHLVRYIKSSIKSEKISEKFIADKDLLFRHSVFGALKNTVAICIAKILPLNLILTGWEE